MDCGIPFCHQGCPLGNLIPEWNDLVYRDEWREAIERLHATNNFPEFTGTLCPAPCEAACVLAINSDAVTIKQVELQTIDHAWERGWVVPQPPPAKTGKKVAVVGSGPAGLAAAQQLTRVGHDVTVFERADRIGGLLRYGIPEFKMEKFRLDRRLAQMEAEGTVFRPGVNVGTDITVEQLRPSSTRSCSPAAPPRPATCPRPGASSTGIHQAMEYLPWANRVQQGDLEEPPITAEGKHVVIVGGGDTGADCLGTAHRQGAASVTQLEIMPLPPEKRTEDMPWPTYPMIYRVSSAHEEGGERRLRGEHRGVHRRRRRQRRDAEARSRSPATRTAGSCRSRAPSRRSRRSWCCSRWASSARRRARCSTGWGWSSTRAATSRATTNFMTSVPGVFAAGDMGRGQSLIVWAIAEGRAAAAGVDAYLTGRTVLPRPINPTDRPLVA